MKFLKIAVITLALILAAAATIGFFLCRRYDQEKLAIDDAAHVPFYDRPELVNPMLIDFLRR